MNLTFILQDIVTLIFTNKMDRFFIYPSVQQFTDLILVVSSVVILNWYQTNILKGLADTTELDDKARALRIIANFKAEIDFPFQYLFACNVICLIARISVILQFSESIGPLVKIVSKMSEDFYNFLILYFLLAIMFTTIANLNFVYDLE